MKRFAVCMALFVLMACAGVHAREQVLLPVMKQTWPSVRTDVERGLRVTNLPQDELAKMDSAIASDSVSAVVAVDWMSLESAGVLGIADQVANQEIGPGVASLLQEQLNQFGNAWRKLAGVTQ